MKESKPKRSTPSSSPDRLNIVILIGVGHELGLRLRDEINRAGLGWSAGREVHVCLSWRWARKVRVALEGILLLERFELELLVSICRFDVLRFSGDAFFLIIIGKDSLRFFLCLDLSLVFIVIRRFRVAVFDALGV